MHAICVTLTISLGDIKPRNFLEVAAAGGHNLLSVDAPAGLAAKDSVTISVRSLGEGSKRWFALDSDQEKLPALLGKLRAALVVVED